MAEGGEGVVFERENFIHKTVHCGHHLLGEVSK